MDDIVTLKTYLQGCCGNYPVPDETLTYICVKKGQSLDNDVAMLTERERDMIELEMLNYLLRAPMMTSSQEDKNGTWSHKDGAVEMNSTDKKFLMAQRKELEAKYNIHRSTAKFTNYGIKIC